MGPQSGVPYLKSNKPIGKTSIATLRDVEDGILSCERAEGICIRLGISYKKFCDSTSHTYHAEDGTECFSDQTVIDVPEEEVADED
jgi:hypothetical protein